MTDPARISYSPLESNPDVFNTVTHSLGANNFEWHDVHGRTAGRKCFAEMGFAEYPAKVAGSLMAH